MRIVLTSFLIALSSLLFGQNDIPNPDFENWQSGGGFFNSYNDPVGWETVNSATNALGVHTAKRTSSPQYVHSGQYALKLETLLLPIVNQVVPGICVTGNIDIDNQDVNGGIPFNQRPHALNGWFQYYPQQGDTGQVGVILTRWNTFDNQRDTIGTGGFFALGTTPSYSFFNGVIEYYSDQNPDTMMIVLVSSSRFAPRVGSTLYVDNLSLEYGVTDILAQSRNDIRVFPNPVRDKLFFEVEGAEILQFINAEGKLAQTTGLQSGQPSVSVSGLPGGNYILRFLGNGGRAISQSRIIIVH